MAGSQEPGWGEPLSPLRVNILELHDCVPRAGCSALQEMAPLIARSPGSPATSAQYRRWLCLARTALKVLPILFRCAHRRRVSKETRKSVVLNGIGSL